MADRLESETRLGGPGHSEDGPPLGAQAPDATEVWDATISEVSSETKMLISRCLDGSEPLDRPLKTWEPDKFNPKTVQVALLRAGGWKNKDIAALLEMDPNTVSVIVNHPYGKKIITSMLQYQGARVVDIKTKLERYSDLMLDHTIKMALVEQDLTVASRVTFGLLDRAGYGPTSKIETKNDKESSSLANNSHLLGRIVTALDESDSVARVTQHFRQAPPPVEAPGTVGRDPESRASEAERPRSSLVPSADLQFPRTGT